MDKKYNTYCQDNTHKHAHTRHQDNDSTHTHLLSMQTGQHMVALEMTTSPLQLPMGSQSGDGVLGEEHVTRPLVHRHCSHSGEVNVSLWTLITPPVALHGSVERLVHNGVCIPTL